MGNCCSGETGRTVGTKGKAFPGQGRTLGDPATKLGSVEMQSIRPPAQPAPVAQRASPPVAPAHTNRRVNSPFKTSSPGRTLSQSPATTDATSSRLTPQQAAAKAAEERQRKNNEKLGKTHTSSRLKHLEAESAAGSAAANLEWRQD